jgi:chaperonin GroES
MIFQPNNDNIIAEPEKAQTMSKSGLYLGTGGNREQPRLAKVIAIGPNVKSIKVGDRILFQAFATADLKVGDEEYLAIREEFVVATVEPEEAK